MSERVMVRARFDASRHQNLTEYRLSRDLEEFEEAWEATRRKQMLAGMQEPAWIAPVIAIVSVVLAIALILLVGSF